MEIKIWEIFNRLELLEWWNILAKEKVLWECICWVEKYISYADVKYWNTKSCWCLAKESISDIWKSSKTHGMSKTKIYKVFDWVNQRCNNPNKYAYENYWGRGIICEWKKFEEFYEDMKYWYKEWLQLDRIDNNWNYCKENCRWTTPKINSNNKRTNINITYNWKTQTLKQWTEQLGLKYWTTKDRIERQGLTLDQIINL